MQGSSLHFRRWHNKMAGGTPDTFPEAVSCILRGWGALRLATEQSFGGPYSQQKAEWLEDVVVQFFVENGWWL